MPCPGLRLAGFHLSITGRFWASTEGQNPAARLESKIQLLLAVRPMKRRELHQRLSGRVKSRDLHQTLETLIDLERIVELSDGRLAWTDASYMDPAIVAQQEAPC